MLTPFIVKVSVLGCFPLCKHYIVRVCLYGKLNSHRQDYMTMKSSQIESIRNFSLFRRHTIKCKTIDRVVDIRHRVNAL